MEAGSARFFYNQKIRRCLERRIGLTDVAKFQYTGSLCREAGEETVLPDREKRCLLLKQLDAFEIQKQNRSAFQLDKPILGKLFQHPCDSLPRRTDLLRDLLMGHADGR